MTLLLPIDLKAAIVSLPCAGSRRFRPLTCRWPALKHSASVLWVFVALFTFSEAHMKGGGVSYEEPAGGLVSRSYFFKMTCIVNACVFTCLHACGYMCAVVCSEARGRLEGVDFAFCHVSQRLSSVGQAWQ